MNLLVLSLWENWTISIACFPLKFLFKFHFIYLCLYALLLTNTNSTFTIDGGKTEARRRDKKIWKKWCRVRIEVGLERVKWLKTSSQTQSNRSLLVSSRKICFNEKRNENEKRQNFHIILLLLIKCVADKTPSLPQKNNKRRLENVQQQFFPFSALTVTSARVARDIFIYFISFIF